MDKNIIYLIIAIVLLVIVYKFWYEPKQEQGSYPYQENYEDSDNIIVEETEDTVNDTIDALQEEEPNMAKDAPQDSVLPLNDWPDKAPNGKYIHSSYVSGTRGNSQRVLESQDSFNTELAASIDYDKYATNDTFTGVNEGEDLKPYKTTQKRPLTTKELYDVGKLLPGETGKDWFEVAPDPIKVKNRHLVNISRPIGLDTVGSSKKNMSRDLRGDVLNPKRIVSPWMNSSISPDLPTVGLCNDISL